MSTRHLVVWALVAAAVGGAVVLVGCDSDDGPGPGPAVGGSGPGGPFASIGIHP